MELFNEPTMGTFARLALDEGIFPQCKKIQKKMLRWRNVTDSIQDLLCVLEENTSTSTEVYHYCHRLLHELTEDEEDGE